jgi:hypothetical protein
MSRHLPTLPDGSPIRLSAGAHSSPGEGICVVELSSMIAGEEFSDRPLCVCPVIGAFLRGWNDRASHAERQLLAPYAARIVGSRADPRVTRKRREMCLQWAGAGLRRDRPPSLLTEAATRLRMAILCGLDAALRPDEGAGDLAARAAFGRGDADGAFELLEALLSVVDDRRRDPRWAASAGDGHARMNGRVQSPTSNGRPMPELDPPPPGHGSLRSEPPPAAALGNGLSHGAGSSNGNGSLDGSARSGRGARPTPARRAP